MPSLRAKKTVYMLVGGKEFEKLIKANIHDLANKVNLQINLFGRAEDKIS